MSIDYQKVMAIIEDEAHNEFTYAVDAWKKAYQTLNPIKRIRLKREWRTHHYNGLCIDQAIRRIEQEMES